MGSLNLVFGTQVVMRVWGQNDPDLEIRQLLFHEEMLQNNSLWYTRGIRGDVVWYSIVQSIYVEAKTINQDFYCKLIILHNIFKFGSLGRT